MGEASELERVLEGMIRGQRARGGERDAERSVAEASLPRWREVERLVALQGREAEREAVEECLSSRRGLLRG